jgi:hypothetical protein
LRTFVGTFVGNFVEKSNVCADSLDKVFDEVFDQAGAHRFWDKLYPVSHRMALGLAAPTERAVETGFGSGTGTRAGGIPIETAMAA